MVLKSADVDELLLPGGGHGTQGAACCQHSDYTVGWICALPIELAAAKLMLDSEHSRLQTADGDKNTYTLGRIAAHCVAMTCLPHGAMGTNAAAAVATNMSRSFPQLRFILLVGIGGGVPDPDHQDPSSDMRLGDVVVSKPVHDYGGVIQYDFGKTVQTHTFQRKGTALDKPPSVLRSAVSDLEATHLILRSKITDIMDDIFTLRPALERSFSRPEPSNDQLFETDYVHVEDNSGCQFCDPNRLVRRADREDLGPVVHYGLIASANQVMRDAQTRENIRQDLGILCFEMEAAGLMDNCPCLVIRGICDYSDSHKNKRWQPYAALAAAAYAKELLQTLSPTSVTSEEAIQIIADPVTHSLLFESNEIARQQYAQTVSHQDNLTLQYRSDRERACLQAFSIDDYERAKDDNPEHAPHTCVWVTDHAKFYNWHASEKSGLLWISADPGCGKSVLARHLVDNVLPGLGFQSVCYFFFKDNNEYQDNLGACLCALVHQSLSMQPHLINIALPAFDRWSGLLPKQDNELWRLLLAIAGKSDGMVCVIDALDECRDIGLMNLLDKFQDFCRSVDSDVRDPKIKFVVTSRPYNNIRAKFERFPASALMRLQGEDENSKINSEINRVVEQEMRILAEDLNLQPDTTFRLTDTLQSMKHRTYLWLHLAKSDIRETYENSLRPEIETINALPRTVEDAYEKILNRISEKNRETVKLILRIVVTARRPLTIKELAVALGFATFPEFTSSVSPAVNATHLERNIRQWCGLFVFLSRDQVFLIHQTAREFLITQGGRSPSDPSYWKHSLENVENEIVMLKICVDYLMWAFCNGKLQPVSSNDDLDTFATYAAAYWPDHTSVAQFATILRVHVVVQLSDPASDIFAQWFPIATRILCPDEKKLPAVQAALKEAFIAHRAVMLRMTGGKVHDIINVSPSDKEELMRMSRESRDMVNRVLAEVGSEVGFVNTTQEAPESKFNWVQDDDVQGKRSG